MSDTKDVAVSYQARLLEAVDTDADWKAAYESVLAKATALAECVPIVHVTSDRIERNGHVFDLVNEFSSFDEPQIPCSDNKAYCSDATRNAEAELNIPPCVYFYAGRGDTAFGSIALAYGTAFFNDIETGAISGAATPFDTGGVIAGYIDMDLPDEEQRADETLVSYTVTYTSDDARTRTQELQAGIEQLRDELHSLGYLAAPDAEMSLPAGEVRARIYDAAAHVVYIVRISTIDTSSDEIRATRVSRPLVCEFYAQATAQLSPNETATWRNAFSTFIAAHYSDPVAYLKGLTPDRYLGFGVAFRRNADSRCWTTEVRLHAPVPLLAADFWAAHDGALRAILDAVETSSAHTLRNASTWARFRRNRISPTDTLSPFRPVAEVNRRVSEMVCTTQP